MHTTIPYLNLPASPARFKLPYPRLRPLAALWAIDLALRQLSNRETLRWSADWLEEDSAFSQLSNIKLDRRHIDTSGWRPHVRQQLLAQRSEWMARKLDSRQALLRNIQLLGELLGLQAVEKAILLFALVSKLCHLSEVVDWHPCIELPELIDLLSSMTGHDEQDIARALSPESPLHHAGLIKVDQDNTFRLENLLEVSGGLAHALTLPFRNPQQLMHHFIQTMAPTSLDLRHFPHLEKDADLLQRLLTAAMAAGTPGINILLHGAPGVGKTAFASALAQSLGLPLYAVPARGKEKFIPLGEERLDAYCLSQKLMAQGQPCLMLFDEMEDVFMTRDNLFSLMGMSQGMSNRKGWINHMLERNPVPTLWVSNDINIDPAYLRRFDYSIHLRQPPASVRQHIARQYLVPLSRDSQWIGHLSDCEHITPALFDNAARIATLSGQHDAQRQQDAERVISAGLRLLGQRPLPVQHRAQPSFDRTLLNTDSDLEALCAGLSRQGHGTLCLYGPPGTGKSALAHHLGALTGKPVMVRQASDLLSSWVGETEQRIAAMFEQAEAQDSLLLLDEADSFLQERRGARNSWEVTQVNELLTRMDSFQGLFVCTTNLIGNLDQAAMRRFMFKIGFDYLKPEQAAQLFVQSFVLAGGDEQAAKQAQEAVKSLRCLTPGDFAVVSRQSAMLGGTPQAAQWLDNLERECRHKQQTSRIGFA